MQIRRNLQHPLLLQKDEDDWAVPDILLLWLHRHVLPGPRNHVWGAWVPRVILVCPQNLQEYQV